MNLVESYKRIRPGIVAFAPRYLDKLDPPARSGATHFEHVFGTGFIVGDSVIATNAHVAEHFLEFQDRDSGDIGVVAIAFARLTAGMGIALLNVSDAFIVKSIVPTEDIYYYGPERPDLALVSVDCKGLARLALTLKPEPMYEGTSIATAGFPMGDMLLHLEGQLDHISPTLQSGIISAVLPFPECSWPHGYLINAMVQEGASGSPVF